MSYMYVKGDIVFGLDSLFWRKCAGLAGLALEDAALIVHDEVSGRNSAIPIGHKFRRSHYEDGVLNIGRG